MQQYDKSSKWLIQHHGDSILRLGGLRDIVSWRALQAEVVQPRQLPDGLLEVQLPGQEGPDLFILELATRAEARLSEQIWRDVALVYLDRQTLPEVLTVVLNRAGGHVAPAQSLQSRQGWTQWQVSWRVVELWQLPAEELLAIPDVGIVPWVPLAQFSGPPEALLQQCRQRIDQEAPREEHENLLAVTRVLASLRYNDPQLMALLGGKATMLEFPAIQELLMEKQQEDILKFLKARFGTVPQDLAAEIRAIQNEPKLDALLEHAALAADLDTFRARARS